MIIECPECGAKAKVRDELAGKRVRCPQCKSEYEAGATTSKAQWYYAIGDKKAGPFDQAEFDSAVKHGVISGKSMVWRKGMTSWQRLDEIKQNKGSKGAMGMKYAGWGKRILAKLVDIILMAVLAMAVEGFSRKLFPAGYSSSDMLNPVFLSTMILNMLLGIFYITWFVGKFGATPGKMAVKIKIVDPQGGSLSYGQAFGRYCGEFVVVFLTVMLGYLFGLFDAQKRTLHDRLCNTRVIEA